MSRHVSISVFRFFFTAAIVFAPAVLGAAAPSSTSVTTSGTPAGAGQNVTFAAKVSGSPSVSNAVFFGGAGDQRASGISIANGKIYLSGVNAATQQSMGLSYAIPPAAAPAWNFNFPNGASGQEYFNGVSASPEGVYFSGYSFALTTDNVGGKEIKGITAKFPLSGNTGAGPSGSTWVRQTPAPPGAYGYGGGEVCNGCVVVNEQGNYFLYAAGNGQLNAATGERFFLSKIDSNSNIIWTMNDGPDQVGTSNSKGIAVAALNGFIYVAGYNADTGSARGYLRKYDPNGGLVWSRALSPFVYT